MRMQDVERHQPKAKAGYRNVEYDIQPVGEGNWKWAYYPKKGRGVAERGTVSGSSDDAVAACKKAIDASLE